MLCCITDEARAKASVSESSASSAKPEPHELEYQSRMVSTTVLLLFFSFQQPAICFRCHAAQAGVRTFRIVSYPTFFNDVPGFCKTFEPVKIQAFVPQPSVEALNVSILRRASWFSEYMVDLVFFTSVMNKATCKF